MSALARLSGVPAATIKHYLREGLLPQPALKTARNMALYDPKLAERIKQIKSLQREHFLPLRLIKSVLDGEPSKDADAETRAAIARALESLAPRETRTRAQVIAAAGSERELALFESLGLVTPIKVDGEDTFSGDDLSLLRLLREARRAGLTDEMLPPEIIGPYVLAIRELARIELDMYRHGVVPRAGANLAKITEAATRLSEQLVVLVCRKMLLPTLEELVASHARTSAPAQPRAKSRSPRRGHPVPTPTTRKKERR